MSLVEKIAVNIGKQTRSILELDDDTEEVVIYGAVNLIQVSLGLLFTIIIGFIFGVLYEALLFTLTSAILKKCSGGPHASSPGRCLFMGSTISVGVSLFISNILSMQNLWIISIAGGLSIIIAIYIIIIKAPVASENKPITSIKMRRRLKRNCIRIVLIFSIIMIVSLILFKVSQNSFYIKIFQCICLGTLWQTVTLTKPIIRFLHKFDSLLPF